MTNYTPTPAANEGPPVCYRHPDRVAYVRCQRCDRPVCPECQRPAAVGVQCPDCVKQANKAIGPARSALGAPISGGKPVVTITIIATCIVFFVLQQVAPQLTSALWFIPGFGVSKPWTFLTDSLLHGSIMHIVFNMYALWVVGSYLEQMLGRWRYIALYLTSALGGSALVLLLATPLPLTRENLSQAWWTPTLGASAAIFGLFATILMVTKRLGQDARGIYVVIGINVVISFIGANISWQGHLGGLATGLLLGAAYAFAPKERRVLYSVGATLVIAGLLVVLIVIKYAGVPAALLV